MSIVNISCYKFISLHDRESLKTSMSEYFSSLGVLGTVLLAPEGINVFLAGSREVIDQAVAWLRADARFADLAPKESLSATAPFRKLRVRLKKEIITMKRPLIRPEEGRAPVVPAATLKHWLDSGHDDAGRPVVLLDTRNDYEVAAGCFEHALEYGIRVFSEFADQLDARREELSGKTVVSYCTGGIRCEKAALHMKALGIEHVYQLEGGILKYFEEVGGAHYQGHCFVFDEREGVASDLSPAQADIP